MKKVLCVLAITLLFSCKLPEPDETIIEPEITIDTEWEYTTFEEVSQPYLDKYGEPEEVYEYDSGDYHSIDWWWWTKGFNVTFVELYVWGWMVDSTYTFSPIGTLQD